ncbi:MAG: glycosyltransferase family 2 protein [Candidatus Fimenecus sp.]
MIQVSVVVATYRRDSDLERTLVSLAEQNYPNIEIVLVDDNGNEEWNLKVEQVVQSFRRTYPNAVLNCIVNKANQGSAETRNIGIAASNGKYITFLDDDDIYLPQKIQRQVTFMESGSYDYSITDLNLFNAHERCIDRRVRSYIKDTSPQALQRYHLKYHLTGTDTMMFTKEYLGKIGGFAPIDVGDEFYLMQRAIDGNGKFGYLPGCDVKAYIHTGEGGLSSGEGKINGENVLYAYKKTYFAKVDAETRRYIKMRHYAVLAFAELRRKHMFSFVCQACKAFFCAPIACVKMLFLER